MQEDHQFRISHVYLEIHKKVNYNSFILKNHKLYIKKLWFDLFVGPLEVGPGFITGL